MSLPRNAYLGAVTSTRRRLDGSGLLRAWDARAAAHPRGPVAYGRSLLAVHDAADLVALDLPWWTYRAIDRVEAFLQGRRGARVLEYGSGASTVWIARRAAEVHAVEHDGAWAEVVAGLVEEAGVAPRVDLRRVPGEPAAVPAVASSREPGLDFGTYVRTGADIGDTFDLVCVDGRAREACVRAAAPLVRPGGLLLLDDAQRARYRPPVDELAAAGWSVLRTRGLTPCMPFPRETVLATPPTA